jgi:hypothetical protein
MKTKETTHKLKHSNSEITQCKRKLACKHLSQTAEILWPCQTSQGPGKKCDGEHVTWKTRQVNQKESGF